MEIAKNTMVRWINAKAARPSNDGHFLCKTAAGAFLDADYCRETDNFAIGTDRSIAVDVLWWALLPEVDA